MKSSRSIALAVLSAASFSFSLASCTVGGGADVVNPTVSELDRLDAQWGLKPREARGTPKRAYRMPDSGVSSSGAAPAPAPAPSAPAAPASTPAPAAPAQPQLDPGLIDSLR